MPASAPKPFTAHVDPDEAVRQDLTVSIATPAATRADGRPAVAPEHHGAVEGGKLAVRARQQAQRARSGRAAAGKARYAFRRR